MSKIQAALRVMWRTVSHRSACRSAIAASAGSGTTAPTFALTLTRNTSNTNVAGRYGAYSIYVNMPGTPVPTISACPGGSGNCDELLK